MLYDVIRYESSAKDDWLLYKHPIDQFNTKSKLIVSPSQVALIVHNGKLEKIVQNGTHTLNTEFLPIIKNFTNLIHYGKNAYPCEIYFINKKVKLDFLWGTTDPIVLIDPVYQIALKLRARGQFGISLSEYQNFFTNFIGTFNKGELITFEILNKFFRGIINQKLKDVLSTYIIDNRVTFFEIAKHYDEIKNLFQLRISPELEKLGFSLNNLSIESINCPEKDLDELSKVFNKRAAYDQLGDEKYRITRGYDIYEKGVSNQGTTGTFIGLGLGHSIGGSMKHIIPEKSDKNKTKFCAECGKEISIKSKFCPECGKPINDTCICGALLKKGAKFCSECGKKV